MVNNQPVGGDDCLYLNVTTKNLSEKKPVMVWIHGGGFTTGSAGAKLHRPDYFLQHDIVFVSINYRLGILGFLNMNIDCCAGNQGLKDQVLALNWVQENIENFGGDKNNVTIFGESAGGVSIHYLCISPLAKGLFHKAIIQSAAANNPWAFQFSNKEYAIKLAAKLGNSSSNPEETVKFLQTLAAQDIVVAQKKVFVNKAKVLDFLFVPTVDDNSSNPFLPKPLNETLENGIDVPVIIGYTSDEGILTLADGDSESDEFYQNCDKTFETDLASDFKLKSSTLVCHLSKEVKNYYFKGNPVTKKDQAALIQYKSDVNFVNGIMQMLDIQCQKNTPTYLYKYSHNPEISLVQMAFNLKVKGACHADDLTHLFYMTTFNARLQLKCGTTDYLLMEHMTKMWTDFAKTGNPTSSGAVNIKWPPYISEQKSCLQIKKDLEIIENFEEESWKFWKPILNKYKLF
ncbi:venom carboxylesterase-6-like isoform X2 [Belonocnema kinseyi]|nr:venom carboxylesterase-6-like isoform X2 [Belonocnema kinseyi]XP_033209373.1 venom carboxylesterase-6-like isoform X2 [Belonocnema kinseyi]XP_033209383.1 venom carboxylesterase-6-like isoform X2 [Belonocnema kinseyi]XP_033209392.1 venom carboxylesterase-6-like isoform X2 [Belonocnema kinseyi]